jgi:hypothetical protein
MPSEIVQISCLVVLLKLTCFLIGYLTIRLGYKLILAGVKGEFNFSAKYEGKEAALVSSSPGLLFVLLGIILIAYAMFLTKTEQYDTHTSKATAVKKEIFRPDSTVKDSL